MRKCVCISCFDQYSTRIEGLLNFFETKEYDITYAYADYDHFAKKENENVYNRGIRIRVPRYKKNLSISRLFSHLVFSSRVRELINRISPDLIYCIVPPNSLVKTLANYKKQHPNTKVIFDVYDMWPESFPYTKKTKILSYPFSVWGELRSRNLSKADLILCVSEQGKAIILNEAGSVPVKVVKPVITPGKMPHYSADDERMTFCYLGMVNHITDIDFGVEFLGAVAKVKQTILHIIGEGQNLEKFVSKLESRNVEVVCHGCVFDREGKNRIFELCNMGLNIPRKEIDSTMSLKAVEYMRVGLPFVNNANGDIRQIVEQDRIGLNFEGDMKAIVDETLLLKKQDFVDMHLRCVNSYKDRFLSQDYEEILEGLTR